jgi:hypothetical protein
MTRNGKIARLPREVRTQLNRRLSEGEPGFRILEWLNSLPDVRAILHSDFASRDINHQNLSDWRNGGYTEWLSQQEALSELSELAANACEVAGVVNGRISDHLATALAARYAAEFAHWTGGDDEALHRRLRILREICQDIVELRRGDHEAARLQIEQARLDQDREKTEADVVQYFLRWIQYPKVREAILSPDDPEKLLREVLGPEPQSKPPGPLPQVS